MPITPFGTFLAHDEMLARVKHRDNFLKPWREAATSAQDADLVAYLDGEIDKADKIEEALK